MYLHHSSANTLFPFQYKILDCLRLSFPLFNRLSSNWIQPLNLSFISFRFALNNDRTKFSTPSSIYLFNRSSFYVNSQSKKGKRNRVNLVAKTFKKKKKSKITFRSRRVRLFTLETFTRCCESATFTVKREHDGTSTLNGPRYFCSFSMPRRGYDATRSPFNFHTMLLLLLRCVLCSFAYFPTRTPEFRTWER